MTLDHQPAQNTVEDICTVCGRRAGECRESFSHLGHQAKVITICSPKCMEAFQRDRIASPQMSGRDH